MQFDPESEIIITAGAMQGIAATLFTFIKPGDEVIVIEPAYSYYRRIITQLGATVKTVNLKFGERWKLDLDEIEKAITQKTKLVITCNPNNPTGNIYTKQELTELAEICLKHNLLILSDDVYENLIYTNVKPYHLQSNSKYRNNVIRLVSLSKDFNLTGWRIGFLHADKSLVEKIMPCHDSLINCAPVVSQYAGLAAIKNHQYLLEKHSSKYLKQRDLVTKFLKNIQDKVDFVEPEGTYYYFVKIKGLTNSEGFCMDLLQKAKVTVVPGSEFGDAGEGFIRICFGRDYQDLTKGLERMKEYFTKTDSLNFGRLRLNLE